MLAMLRSRVVESLSGGHSRGSVAALLTVAPTTGGSNWVISRSVVRAAFSPNVFWAMTLTVVLTNIASELDFPTGSVSGSSTAVSA